jgi:hypothetical protein
MKFMSLVISVAPIILQLLILKKVGAYTYGLRLMPFYGQYFFYSKLVPRKSNVAMLLTMTNIVQYLFLIFMFTGKNRNTLNGLLQLSNGVEVGPDMERQIVSLILIFLLVSMLFVIVMIIFRIILNIPLAEKFGYSSGIGVLAGIVPVIGAIMFYIAASDGKFDKSELENDY